LCACDTPLTILTYWVGLQLCSLVSMPENELDALTYQPLRIIAPTKGYALGIFEEKMPKLTMVTFVYPRERDYDINTLWVLKHSANIRQSKYILHHLR
jgi:hypothetical protein